MPDPDFALQLSSEDLALLFPAYMEVDPDGAIGRIGPSIRKKFGEELRGRSLFGAFAVEHPVDIGCVADLRDVDGTVILASTCGHRLRGIAMFRGESTLLLVSHVPKLDHATERVDLEFSDFSPVDGTVDMLLALDFRAGLLADARNLAGRLQVERHAAERANQAKTSFLATMSHEIRTPMNGILGIASILANTPLTTEQNDLVATMRDSGEALLSILSNVLDISKIESGSLEIEEETFSMVRTAEDVCALFQPIAEAKGLAFRCDVVPSHDCLLGDSGRVRQIVTNLLSNAIKFTEVGSVSLKIRDNREGDWIVCTLEVIDTGIGIGSHALEKMFEPFRQADSSTTRRFGGSGLGLAITRRLCERMGGQVQVESRVGRGSHFTVTLAFRPGQPGETSTAPARADGYEASRESQRVPKVLVVDDNATNRLVVSKYLDRLGVKHECTHDGIQALTAWENGDFTVILMDFQMPRFDGFEATRELRRRELALDRNRVSVIGLTADAMAERRDEAFKAGMDDILIKPLRISDLQAVLGISRQTTAPQPRTDSVE